jgi:hypothetical protein
MNHKGSPYLMARKRKPRAERQPHEHKPTPTFLLELPLQVIPSQAKRLRAHLEAARQLYNAILSEGQRRLRRMRADPAWQAARAIPRTSAQERKTAFGTLRQRYGFSEYALHDAAKGLNCCWIADHVDAVLAQTLASRAYRAQKEGVPGAGPARAVSQPEPGDRQPREQTHRHRAALRAPAAGGGQRRVSGVAR